MRRHFPEDAHVHLQDVTSGFAQLNLQGPRSRDLLHALTGADVSNEAFPFRAAREIDIGYARVLCIRITYLGELGYELYIPTEQAMHVYERIVEAGAHFGLRHAGLKALASLRMEKGYRDYGHDIDNTIRCSRPGWGSPSISRRPAASWARKRCWRRRTPGRSEAAGAVPAEGPRGAALSRRADLRDGKALGYIRAASYGHTLGGAVGLAMIEAGEPIDQKFLDAGHWEIDVAGTRVPATASLKPLYDAANQRIKM
jgi:4-methylaminobutanoate oxidase (formaldehyde-forming)